MMVRARVLSLTSWDLQHPWTHVPMCNKRVQSLLPFGRDTSPARPHCAPLPRAPRQHGACMRSRPRAPVPHEHQETSCQDGNSRLLLIPLQPPPSSSLLEAGDRDKPREHVRQAGNSKQAYHCRGRGIPGEGHPATGTGPSSRHAGSMVLGAQAGTPLGS